jgi:hypothetical protein
MSRKSTKSKKPNNNVATDENDEKKNPKVFIKRLLEEALAVRKYDVETLRQLVSQVDGASEYLINKFGKEADECSDVSALAMELSYYEWDWDWDWDGKYESLDALLHHLIVKEQQRQEEIRRRNEEDEVKEDWRPRRRRAA